AFTRPERAEAIARPGRDPRPAARRRDRPRPGAHLPGSVLGDRPNQKDV
ncbi:MAG: hypothetical protein AVDCRST_MAG49-1154, partial [uncultured Thermomicrobiales bacterium]